MTEWLASSDAWPKHPGCKEWNDALSLARSKGWSLRLFSGHRWGMIVCRRTADGDYCEIRIDSSASGTESVARDSLLEIERCSHIQDAVGALTPEEAARTRRSTFSKARAARRCMTGLRKIDRASSLLADALDGLDQLDAAAALEGEGFADVRDGLSEVASWGVDVSTPVAPVSPQVMSPALDTAEATLNDVDRSADETDKWDKVRTTSKALREEVDTLRTQIPQATDPGRR